ncbi:hypothetical protein [Salicibibacter cibi]|nr:hypothetical protein [Salicibibacter cibi]
MKKGLFSAVVLGASFTLNSLSAFAEADAARDSLTHTFCYPPPVT